MAIETSTLNTLRQLFIVVSVAITAFLYYKKTFELEKERVSNVLAGLLAEEKSVNISTDVSVAVGFGSCVDIFVSGIALVNALKVTPPENPVYHDSIKTLKDVSEMFALYLSEGAAAERYIPDELLKVLVDKADALGGSWRVGGNAPVIASRFAKTGFKVYVGGKGSKKFSSSYHENLEFSEGYGEQDDVHLIMEFKVGETWGNYTVKRANRFILHSDKNNPRISSLESFASIVDTVQPRLVVIGGLQMLDNVKFKEGEREERMEKVKEWLKAIPQSTLIHFEMASFAEYEMMDSLIQNILPYVDSLGMNEQELPNIVGMVTNGTTIEVADANPRTARVLDDLRELILRVGAVSERGLSRVHVHTLAWQAVWVKKGSVWKNTRAGCARSSLMANRHVCGVDDVNPENSRLIMDDSFSLTTKSRDKRINFNEHSPISCWDEEPGEMCLAPVLVCTQVYQTAGGGDNITPAGLMPQL